jgi:potassium-transporting ATPase KdpC subunit
MKQLIIAIKAAVVLTILTGIVYPLLVTGLAKALFPRQANGSMVQANGRTIGSAIIGQGFTKPWYFHGRPSASNYDGLSSGGSNLGPTNKKLVDRVEADLKAFRAGNPTFQGPAPPDLLTASGSGLDPDLSPASAEAQAARVATARGMDPAALERLIEANTEGRQYGFFGEPRVNVLMLNMALDRAAPVRK